MSVRLSVETGKTRAAAIRLASLTLRCMENWSRAAGGYDEAMIVVAVVAITSERLMRSGVPTGYEKLEQAFPVENLAPCSISSIAAATGLNRETARRKVDQLVQAGFLTRSKAGGVRFRDGLLQDPRTIELISSQLEAFRRAAEGFIRDEVLTVE